VRFDTRLVHVGQEPEPGTGGVVPPIHVATTYDRREQDPPRYFYGRGENPTREGLERCLASLEDARFATAFSSGQAAAATALALVPAGRRVVCVDDVYPGTDALLGMAAERGVLVDYADLSDPGRLDAALAAPDLGMVWVETPTNPLLKLVDIRRAARLAHERGALLVVDNTFAGPLLQRPLDLGADLTLYSTTKFIAGHSDVIGGALVHDDPALDARLLAYRTTAGNVPGALDCYLVHRGLKTLSLRMRRQVRSAQAVARLLAASPAVGRVNYPGLATHPQHALARAQMRGPGAVMSFEYLGGPVEQLLAGVRLFACGVSLGGVQSLIECPALMTHRPLPPAVRAARGIGDRLIRLSIGIEDVEDLLDDLRQAFSKGAVHDDDPADRGTAGGAVPARTG
jgi:cystathionine beta-lyase/cystathionine gamma-synthase